ncbi:hypothetical protein [Hydrogenovibrio marinus]|uniref:Uncharacterized protein n=1 Tax=Hydrogenovibrio marinus TaxID=28885 RepID=A0A066ZMV1_HYDMR|nr:hypothetical protein [Hydrogenovibrio marinus]KDN94832.1 hypothetical protein EI16_00515 [Hydrogenovibrio marinus]BBN59291.1 hypothetical protein HVMH_0885 [Hydrogenovibrio marinus]
MNISTTHTQNNCKTAIQSMVNGFLRVGKQKTSAIAADPLGTDLRCENEVHCFLFANAFSPTILAFSIYLVLGSAPVSKKVVGFIVTLFF